MKLQRNVIEGVPVIGATDPVAVDAGNCREFRNSFERLLSSGDYHVILDGSSIRSMDAQALSSILDLQKKLGGQNGQIHLAGLNEAVSRVLRGEGLDMLFRTYPGVEQAIRDLREAHGGDSGSET